MPDQSKNHGKCTGCGFPYALTKDGRVRKHNARTGPGLCAGAGEAPQAAYPAPEYNDVAKAVTDTVKRAAGATQDEFTVAPPAPGPEEILVPVNPAADPFTTPSPTGVDVPTETVSGQPDPERDRYGRYLMWFEDGRAAMTRTTTFAKSCSDTYALSEWAQRLTVVGMTKRPDLIAMAHGLEVKRDRKALNGLVEQAKEAAGQKVAANLGTAVHALTERYDAGLLAPEDVPPAQQGAVNAYLNLTATNRLASRREWIERSTAVDVGAERVAGTLDRIYEMPNGDLVIGDLKTGSDLTYGWGEIAVQLAVYARGVNSNGLYDWNTRTWTKLDRPVREDYALVVHVPVDPESPKQPDVYRLDIAEGWEAAELCAAVREWRKAKNLAAPLGADGLPPVAVPEPDPVAAADPLDAKWPGILEAFATADSKARLATLYEHAYSALAGRDDLVQRMEKLTEVGRARLCELDQPPF